MGKHVEFEPVPTWRFLAPKWRHVSAAAPIIEIVGRVGVPEDHQDPDRPYDKQPRAGRPTSMWDDASIVLGRAGLVLSGGIPIWVFGSGTVNPDWDWQIFLAIDPAGPIGKNRSGKPNDDIEQKVQSRGGFGDETEFVGPDGKVVRTDSSLPLGRGRKIRIPVDAAGRPFPLVELEVCTDKRFHDDEPHWVPPIGKEVRVYGHWVEDMSHDFKTEIHPVQWLTWEAYRAPGDTFLEVMFRVTVLTDVTGRFPQEIVNAQIIYTIAAILGKQKLPAGKVIYSEIRHEGTPHWQNDVRKKGECVQTAADRFEFTCSVGPWQGTKAPNCNTTERDSNTGGYWDGFLWFRLKDDPAAGLTPGGTVKPSTPRVDIKISEVRRTESGGLERVVKLKASTEIQSFAPQRDKLQWTLYADGQPYDLEANTLLLEEEVAIPLDETTPRLSGQDKPSGWLPNSETGDRDTMLLAVTVTRDGISDSTAELFLTPYTDVPIFETWTLERTTAAGEQAGSAAWRLRLRTEAPSETAVLRWTLYGQGGEPVEVSADGEALVNYSPENLGSNVFVARAEVFEGNLRLAVGRKVVKIQVFTFTLDLAAAGGEGAQVIARPSDAIGDISYLWMVSSGSQQAGTWSVDGDHVNLSSGGAAYAILVSATDSIGQLAYATRGIAVADLAALSGTQSPTVDYRAAVQDQSLRAMTETNRLLRADVDIMEHVRDMLAAASKEVQSTPGKFFEPIPAGSQTSSFAAQALALIQAEKALLQTFLTGLMTGAPDKPCRVIFDNSNTRDVQNGGKNPSFTVLAANQGRLCHIDTYHWNHGQGQKPGSIGLQDASGAMLGTWPAVASPGQGGAPNVNWTAKPDVALMLTPGTYTVIDSDPATLSQNAQSNGLGFAKVWVEDKP